MKPIQASAFLAGVLFCVAACSEVPVADHADVVRAADNYSRVTLFSSNADFAHCDGSSEQSWNATKIVHSTCLVTTPLSNDPLALEDKESLSKNAFVTCGLSTQPQGSGTAISSLILDPIDWVVSTVISFVGSEADKALQDYVKSFTAQNAVTSKGVDIYAAFPPNLTQLRAPATVCVRYTRFANEKSANETSQATKLIAVDFIGSLTFDPADPNHLTLRPIRLYYASPARIAAGNNLHAGDSSDTVAYKISSGLSIATTTLGFNSTAVDSTQVSMANFGSASVTASDISKSNAAYYHLFLKSNKGDAIPETRIPLPAWNMKGVGRPPESTSADITITITEAGKPNEALAALATWFHKENGTVSKDATTQAEKGICDALDPTGKSCK